MNYGPSPLAVGFVVTGILLVGATLMGIVDGLAVLTGSVPANEEFILLAMLGAAAEWVMIVFVLELVALLFLAAAGISVLRKKSNRRLTIDNSNSDSSTFPVRSGA